MGAKISTTQGIVPVKVKDGKFYLIDKLGVTHVGTLSIDVDFEEDNEFYAELLFIQVRQNGLLFVCRYDRTWSLYRERDMQLLDMGAFQLSDPSILETEYDVVGYYTALGVVYTLFLDRNNRKLLHVVSTLGIGSKRDFIFKEPFNEVVDLERSFAEAHYQGADAEERIYIYTDRGRYNTGGKFL